VDAVRRSFDHFPFHYRVDIDPAVVPAPQNLHVPGIPGDQVVEEMRPLGRFNPEILKIHLDYRDRLADVGPLDRNPQESVT